MRPYIVALEYVEMCGLDLCYHKSVGQEIPRVVVEFCCCCFALFFNPKGHNF